MTDLPQPRRRKYTTGPDEKIVHTAVRLPPALKQRLEEAANERYVSQNFLIVKAVEMFVDRLIPPDEIQWTREPLETQWTREPPMSQRVQLTKGGTGHILTDEPIRPPDVGDPE